MPSIRQLFKSMQFQLIFWSVLALLLLAIIAGGYGFWYSYKEINEFQDDNLKSMSALLEQTLDIGMSDSNQLHETSIHFDTDEDDGSITVDVINTAITAPITYNSLHNDSTSKDHSDDDFDDLTLDDLDSIPVGISTKMIDDHVWRVYRSNNADQVIIVRQRTEFQEDLAKSSAMQSFLPLIVGMTFLMLLLPFIMWRMLKPVRQLQIEINKRQESDLHPLSISNLPTELLPLAESLNRLLALVKISIERQQRFIADAAHELRSPLTAVSLQLQRLQRLTSDAVMTEGLDKLAIRLKRNQRLVEQLLTLARAGNINITNNTKHERISIKTIVEQVIGLLVPIADNKNIELTVQLSDVPTLAAQVSVDETALLMLVKNLIQNAIVYTPDNGQVAVKLSRFSATAKEVRRHDTSLLYSLGTHIIGLTKQNNLPRWLAGRLVLQVMDSGPGIRPDEYKNAFEPFVRLNQISSTVEKTLNNIGLTRSDSATTKSEFIEGTGLGLSIVKSICEQAGIDVFMHGSILTAANREDNRGLCVTLVF
ncbi:two-component system OmpR family sensor kinase [Psychrobacter sp. PL15]|uniref:ATP-binding protein n=1 Tax=Psychrobacter sp. PL15 TaxID=3071719 RepID=UPI002DFA9B96|nr:two-component system OmpR family sensor kinase [Psychrobacter sp. PL15]